MRRKFLSVLLAMAMVLTTVPVTALAIEEANASASIAFEPANADNALAVDGSVKINAGEISGKTLPDNVAILWARSESALATATEAGTDVFAYDKTNGIPYATLFGGVDGDTAAIYAVAVGTPEGGTLGQVSVVTESPAYKKAQVATPEFSPAAGEVDADTEVTISCDTADATIYYTTDGSTPSTSSTQYVTNDKLTIDEAKTLKAIAVKENMKDSVVAEAEYTIKAAEPDEPEEISAVAVTLTAPVAGNKPATTAAPTGDNAAKFKVTSVTWTGAKTSAGNFAAATAYSADVVLTAETGYKFAATGTGIAVAGSKAATQKAVGAEGATLTITVEYNETAAKTLTSLNVTGTPSYKYDDAPDVADFTVKGVYNDKTEETLSTGVTITPSGKFTTVGDVELTFTSGSVSKKVTVTVGKKDVTLAMETAPTATDINFGQALSASRLSGGLVIESGDSSKTPIAGTWKWTTPTDKPTSAGNNQSKGITFVPEENANINYSALTGNAAINVKTIAAQDNITVDIQGGYVQSGYTLPTPATGTGVLNDTVAGTTTWSSDAEGTSPVGTVTGDDGDSVTYYWTFVPTSSTNYTGNVTGTATFNVTDKSILTYEFTNKTVSATYGGVVPENVVKIKIGETDSDSATTGLQFDYESSDTNIATVATDGTVTPVKAGEVTITATHKAASVDGDTYVCNTVSASYKLTIDKAAAASTPSALVKDTDFTVASTSITITAPSTTCQYIVLPNGTAATGSEEGWKDGTSSALTISGLEANTAYKVYVRTKETDTHLASSAIGSDAFTTPAAPSVTSVTVSPTALSLTVGENRDLTATVDPSGTAVTWTSSAPSVATVDTNGKVTAVAAGNATITATAGDKSGSCTVTVTSGGSRPSGGGSGGGGGSTSSTVTVPVSGDDNKVEVSAKVSGSTATIDKIDGLDKVLDSDADTGVVEIDLTALKKDIDTVSISASSIEDIAKAAADSDNDVDGLAVKLDSGTVEFDADALEAIVDQATSSSIQLVLEKTNSSDLNSSQRDAVKDMDIHGHFDLTLTGGKVITDFKGGRVSVRIPFTVPSGKDAANFVVIYVANDGTVEEMRTSCSGGYISFTTDHFSKYLIAYKDSEPVEPVETPETADCDGGANCPAGKFTDVNTDLWYHKAIDYVLTNGLMSGVGDGTFAPNANLSRAMLAQILYNQEGRPAASADSVFDDVAAGMWYTNAIAWAAENGVVSGLGDGKFGPNNNITREQLAVMLYRYAGSPAAAGSLSGFADADKASGYAQNALVWATSNGVMSGKGGGMLDPQGQATRAEVAQMLYNYLNK